jgi:hypothetical protein
LRQKEIVSKSKSYSKLEAFFERKASYSFKNGIQIYPTGYLKIQGKLEVKPQFVTTISIIMGFDLKKLVQVEKIVFFHRGEVNTEQSGAFQIYGVKQDE